jgi:PAS domain S-box-containing protein
MRSTFPRSVYVTIAALFAMGGGLLALHLANETGGAPSILTVAPFYLLVVAGAYLVLHYRYQGHVEAIDLIEASLAPAIVALQPAIAILVATSGVATANLLHRNHPVKAAFNVAQAATSCGIATVIYAALRSGPGLSERNAAALCIGLFTMALFTHLSITIVIVFSKRQPLRRVLEGFAPVILPGWVAGSLVNVSFGLLFAAAHQWSSVMLLVAIMPLTALHVAFRAYAAATADHSRLRGLQTATQTLARPVDPLDAFPEFVQRVRECFDCEAADLVVFDGARRRVYRAEAGIAPRPWTEPVEAPSLAAILGLQRRTARVNAHTEDRPDLTDALAREGWRDCLASPLVDRDEVFGVLCTYNGNGVEAFQQGEATVLEALAREATVAIDKSRLLAEVFDERKKLSEIVEHTSDGILTVAASGEILLWSPGIERISGYLADEMIGTRNLGTLRPRDADGKDLMIERWATNAELVTNVQIVARDGEQRWLSCSYSPVAGPDGSPTMLVIVARDATAQHEVERLKDDFVATVSHELRTPLTPMKAWANTLLHLGDKLDAKQRREGLTTMLRQTDRLERLITNLLEVSKIERGIGEVQDGIVDARAAVTKVVQDAYAAYPAREISITAGRGAFRAVGDDLWIEQIVSNLISNAIKYAPPHEPIDVKLSEGPGTIKVAVSDHGPGIPASQTEKVFDRFHRLGDHLTRAQGGAGLGLYISRRLAQAIGATLAVESQPGEGATFVLTLRAANQLSIVLEDADDPLDDDTQPAALSRIRPATKSVKR